MVDLLETVLGNHRETERAVCPEMGKEKGENAQDQGSKRLCKLVRNRNEENTRNDYPNRRSSNQYGRRNGRFGNFQNRNRRYVELLLAVHPVDPNLPQEGRDSLHRAVHSRYETDLS